MYINKHNINKPTDSNTCKNCIIKNLCINCIALNTYRNKSEQKQPILCEFTKINIWFIFNYIVDQNKKGLFNINTEQYNILKYIYNNALTKYW